MRRSLASLMLVACGGPRAATPPACAADARLVIADQADVRRAAACKTVAALTLKTGAQVNLAELAKLATITGDLVIGPTVGVDEAVLSQLVSVGGTIRIGSNGTLHGVYLPRLERAGRIEIDGNVTLTTVVMPHLAAVAGAVLITENAALELVDAAELVTIGGALVVASDPELGMLDMGRLVKATDIRVERASKLMPEVVEQLGKPGPP